MADGRRGQNMRRMEETVRKLAAELQESREGWFEMQRQLRETQEKLRMTAKGLRMLCEEKSAPCHECCSALVFEVEWQEVGLSDIAGTKRGREGYTLFDESEEPKRIKVTPRISLYALTGTLEVPNLSIMTVNATHGVKKLRVLIDTGSTDNILDADMAKELKLLLEELPAVDVVVPGGQVLSCRRAREYFSCTIQNTQFLLPIHVMSLGTFELVLGIQWLQTLGDMTWNFSTMVMQFIHEGQAVTLKANPTPLAEGNLLQMLKKTSGRSCYRAILQVSNAENSSSDAALVILEHFPMGAKIRFRLGRSKAANASEEQPLEIPFTTSPEREASSDAAGIPHYTRGLE